MEVYGYDPYISVNAAWRLSRNVKHITNVDTIFQECDYITVHVPLLESTKGMINKEKLDMMKDGVVILNFARDTLVNDDDRPRTGGWKSCPLCQRFPKSKGSTYEKCDPHPTSGCFHKESLRTTVR